MTDSNIIPFEKRPRSIYLSLDMNDPELAADIARADEMVSYDIDAMSIEELREHARCSIVIMHKERMRHLESIGKLKREIELTKQGHGAPVRTLGANGADMPREIDLTLSMDDLVKIHDALSQIASKMNDKDFADIFCTIDAITSAIIDNQQEG